MKQHLEQLFNDAIDRFASIEHERWSHWQRHMHDIAKPLANGGLELPAEMVRRWERQIETSFSDLDEKEKESDREQVRRYYPVIFSILENAFSTLD